MKKSIVILLLFAITGVGGCCSMSRDFVNAVDANARVILPAFKEYVENDPSLDPDSRRIRVQTADEFQRLIDEAKKEKRQ